MKAWILHGINELHYEEVEMPVPGQSEVLVRVRAAGICGSDIPRIYQTGAHVHPLIPGHEFSGEVISVGEKADPQWIGKRVGIFPLIPCGKCVSCLKKQYEMCRHYSYLGSRRDGGFAEYVAVPQWNLIPLPKEISFEAAAMLEPMAVAVHAMRSLLGSSDDYKDKSVVVWGLGTIGLLLTMFLKQLDIHRLYVVGNKAFQKELIAKLGMKETQYCDCTKEDARAWVMDMTNGHGADFFFECVGKNETIENAIDLAAPGASVMLVGNPYSDMTLQKTVYWKILRHQLTVKGTWNSSYTGEEADDWHYVLRCLQEKNIHPEQLISHRYEMRELEEGFHIMRDKSQDYVKIIGVQE